MQILSPCNQLVVTVQIICIVHRPCLYHSNRDSAAIRFSVDSFLRMDSKVYVVLISGCSSGIGLDTALLLANDPEKRFKVHSTMRNMVKKGKFKEHGKEYLEKT